MGDFDKQIFLDHPCIKGWISKEEFKQMTSVNIHVPIYRLFIYINYLRVDCHLCTCVWRSINRNCTLWLPGYSQKIIFLKDKLLMSKTKLNLISNWVSIFGIFWFVYLGICLFAKYFLSFNTESSSYFFKWTFLRSFEYMALNEKKPDNFFFDIPVSVSD